MERFIDSKCLSAPIFLWPNTRFPSSTCWKRFRTEVGPGSSCSSNTECRFWGKIYRKEPFSRCLLGLLLRHGDQMLDADTIWWQHGSAGLLWVGPQRRSTARSPTASPPHLQIFEVPAVERDRGCGDADWTPVRQCVLYAFCFCFSAVKGPFGLSDGERPHPPDRLGFAAVGLPRGGGGGR